MVYNALKLFMEINPDLFDDAMQQYKQRKLEYVTPSPQIQQSLTYAHRERQHAVDRYEEWQNLREKALKNCGGKLPPNFVDHPPTPPPPPVDDADIMDLTIDLNAVSIDAEVPLNELDESGIERVPMADPGLDVSGVAGNLSSRWHDDLMQRSF